MERSLEGDQARVIGSIHIGLKIVGLQVFTKARETSAFRNLFLNYHAL